MPDVSGRLTRDELARVQARFAQLWATRAVFCPVTQDSNWFINDLMLAAPAASDRVLWEGLYFPCIAVVCRTCGYTMFFSAGWLGLLSPPQIPPLPQHAPGQPDA